MNNQNDLPLYIAVYKLLKYLYLIIKRFPKEYKYSLGQSIIECSWEVLDHIVTANTLPNSQKEKIIRKASASSDKLKSRLRMAHELKLVGHKQYIFLISQNEEIAKMLNGWLKWSIDKFNVKAQE